MRLVEAHYQRSPPIEEAGPSTTLPGDVEFKGSLLKRVVLPSLVKWLVWITIQSGKLAFYPPECVTHFSLLEGPFRCGLANAHSNGGGHPNP